MVDSNVSYLESEARGRERDAEVEHLAYCMPLNDLVGKLTDKGPEKLAYIMKVATNNGLDPAFVRNNIAYWVESGELEIKTVNTERSSGVGILVYRLEPMTDEQNEREG